MTAAAPKPSIRDYDRARMHKIAQSFWAGLLVACKDDDGTCYLPSGEILDAMALVGGIILSTSPQAKVPSQLCDEHAKKLATRTKEAGAGGASSLFDVVMTDEEAVH